jgi:hypothetical protein
VHDIATGITTDVVDFTIRPARLCRRERDGGSVTGAYFRRTGRHGTGVSGCESSDRPLAWLKSIGPMAGSPGDTHPEGRKGEDGK